MPAEFLKQIRSALSTLNPGHVRQSAERPLAVGMVTADPSAYAVMEDYLAPAGVSRAKRWQAFQSLYRAGDPGAPKRLDIEIWEEGLDVPDDAFVFAADRPERCVHRILERRQELGLALARRFAPFRRPVTSRIVTTISRENALFALATALPDVVPSLTAIPWAVSEFASDTAFLTMNQIRMGFMLAAASDREVGYREQRGEIASLITGAFGWRSLARELAGKIPLGGGLIPKSAIAFAGTYVVGVSLERLYAFGYGYTRAERRRLYQDALERGKQVAGSLLERLRGRRAS
jgi:hypothetical protein